MKPTKRITKSGRLSVERYPLAKIIGSSNIHLDPNQLLADMRKAWNKLHKKNLTKAQISEILYDSFFELFENNTDIIIKGE